MHLRQLVLLALALLPIAGCGARANPAETLSRLRAAIDEPVADTVVLEDHNQLVEDAVQSGALEGLRQYQIQEQLGRGQECGTRSLCADHGFRPTDWVYEIGRDPDDASLPAGPTLIIGFDSSGIVTDTYYLTRRH